MVRSSQLALCCPIEHAPAQVAAEGRTAGNALGQSYGLLNTRAANDFQNRTLSSVHRLDVMPVAAIHDANYCLLVVLIYLQ